MTTIGVLQILIITFTRSGGFAAVPALEVRGTVTIDPPHAVVTAEPNYRRELRDDERQQLSEAASAILESGGDLQSATKDESRDAYHFVFNIQIDGRDTSVHASAGSVTPGPVQQLFEWADREATAIVRARLKQ